MSNDLNMLLNPPQAAPAPQAAPPQYAPQAAPPQYAPQAAPPQYAPQAAPPQYAPQAAPPQYAPQAAPPQYAPQPQAPPVGGKPAQGQHVPLQGGLAQYANQTAGLYNEVGGSHGPKVYFDCDAKYVVELVRLSTGRSTKPQSNGRPYIGANFKVLRVDYCAVDAHQTQIREGTEVSFMKWLPRDPNYPSLEDKYNLVDVLNLGAAIVGLQRSDEEGSPYLNLNLLDQMTQDDGAPVKGKVFGIQVVGKPGKAGTANASKTYFNADFYPVDAQGQRHEGFTPAELQARR